MASSKYHVTIDSVSARIVPGEGTFRERSVRAEITQNLLSQAEGTGLASRPDQPALYQSDWSGGSRWWKPLIKGNEQNTYFISNNLDVWTQPGKVVPLNNLTAISNAFMANYNQASPIVAHNGTVYMLQNDADDDSTHYDVAEWDAANNTFKADVNYNSGVNASADEGAMAMVSDPSDGYVYVVAHDDEITRFNPASEAEDDAWISVAISEGAAIFLANGELMFYSGDKVYTITKSGPTATAVFNDGMGPDILELAANNGPAFDPWWSNLAISTPEGIYYVKNTRQGGTYVAWLFRVDRDEVGNWIGNPLGTLPNGVVAMDITYHLGSVVISAASDFVMSGVSAPANISFYHYTGGQLGVLGSAKGITGTSTTQVYRFLLSDGPYLYLGPDEVWVYDGVRGGIHRVSNGLVAGAATKVVDSTGAQCLLFPGDAVAGTGRLVRLEASLNPDTVSAFGDDETFYTLESNYFDMGLPMEYKEITKVAITADAVASASNNEWTLQISTDDGSFTDALTHSGTAQYAEAVISSGTHRGRLFRYKLIYQTKNTVKRALREVLITANAGQMVREWEMVLDGQSLMNVENAPVRPAAFAEAMRAVAAKEQAVSMVVDYQDDDTSSDTGETVTVKVMSCEISKDSADEALVRLLVREV